MVKQNPHTPPQISAEAHTGARRKVEDDDVGNGRAAKKARTRVRYVSFIYTFTYCQSGASYTKGYRRGERDCRILGIIAHSMPFSEQLIFPVPGNVVHALLAMTQLVAGVVACRQTIPAQRRERYTLPTRRRA